jgi:tetratricopeptide (TPR) repeat protein
MKRVIEISSFERLITSVLFFLIAIQVSSCKKFLDKKPDNSLNVPKTVTDLQALLDDAFSMNTGLTPCFGEASADDYYLLQNDYDTRLTVEQNFYKWIPTEYFFPNDWSKSYIPVYNSNYCLEMLSKIPVSTQNQEQWENVKGSALFYRAYSFLNLTWTFAKAYDENFSNSDLGIALRSSSDFNEPSTRASVKESYEKVISDTKESIRYLPVSAITPYRPSKIAAYGLLARAYLSMRKYDSALAYSNLALQVKSDLIDFKNSSDPDLVVAFTSNSSPFRLFNRETIFYSEMNNSISTIATARGKINASLYASYGSTDLRRTAFFRSSSGQRFKGNYTSNSGIFFTGIATDEMFLIKAECLARRNGPGDKELAMDNLNALLSKRHSAAFSYLSATDSTDAVNKVLLERRKELLMRGLRWIDIKRLNKEVPNIILTRSVGSQTYTLEPNANYYALPLPADIIAISSMTQNPY